MRQKARKRISENRSESETSAAAHVEQRNNLCMDTQVDPEFQLAPIPSLTTCSQIPPAKGFVSQ